MNKEEYYRYLESPEWKAKRDKRISDFRGKCNVCDGRATVVHHSTYARVGHEHRKDLVPACDFCHTLIHACGEVDRTITRYHLTLKRKSEWRTRRLPPGQERHKSLILTAIECYPNRIEHIKRAEAGTFWNYKEDKQSKPKVFVRERLPLRGRFLAKLQRRFKELNSDEQGSFFDWLELTFRVQITRLDQIHKTNADLVNLMNLDATDETNPST